jgi:hypothetical protein
MAAGTLLFLVAGCARLPTGVRISGDEREAVTAAFVEWRAAQRECPCCLDAAATVTFKSWIQSGTLSGFVQAMKPAYLKFVALNPWGQPLLMLVTDGRSFQLVSVPETKAYTGSVRAKAFEKYAPEGARPQDVFFWLTGRLPPVELRIVRVARDEEAAGYWIDLTGKKSRLRHRVLFDPQREVILRHLVLDSRKKMLVDVGYDQFAPAPAVGEVSTICRWPGRIVVKTRKHRGQLIISLSDWRAASFGKRDFHLELPAGYEHINVQ